MEQFSYYDKQISLFTDFDAETGIDWRVEIPQDNGTIIRYTLAYPHPEGSKIRVSYTKSVVLGGELLQTLPAQHYYTSDLPIFYQMALDGTMAAKHTINGLVRRLPELGGHPERADGHLPFDNQGNLVQPVVFELEATLESMEGASDGSIMTTVHNAEGDAEYSFDGGAYQTQPGLAGLSVGTYTVTVRDEAGTERSQSIIVSLAASENV